MSVLRAYEWIVLSRPDLNDEERDKLLEEIQNQFKRQGMELIHHQAMEKKALAYPIHGYREGFYDLFYVVTQTDKVAKISSWLKLKKDILREMPVHINRAHRDHIQKTLNMTLPEFVSFARPK